MYVVVVGAGKVGWNLARELIDKGNELTVIESDAQPLSRPSRRSSSTRAQYGDGSELWVLERAGIERADLVIAVTGDDEDNILICQVAREKYGVERVIARCNNPRNLQHFELLGVKPAVSATDLILRLIEHEVPRVRARCTCSTCRRSGSRSSRSRCGAGSPAAGKQVKDLGVPEGSLVISILRDGTGFVPLADSVVEAGDEVLLVLDTGLEDEDHRAASPRRRRAARRLSVADRAVDYLLIGGGVAAANCARDAARGGRRRRRSCSSGASRTRRTSGRRCRRATCAGDESREDALFRPAEWWEEHGRRAADRVRA